MLEWPFVIVTIGALMAVAIAVGALRRDRPFIVALDAIGFGLFMSGIAWAYHSGRLEAVAAVFVATLGAILFTMSSERRSRATSADEPKEVANGS